MSEREPEVIETEVVRTELPPTLRPVSPQLAAACRVLRESPQRLTATLTARETPGGVVVISACRGTAGVNYPLKTNAPDPLEEARHGPATALASLARLEERGI